MGNIKPVMCGEPKVFIPDDDCSECIHELNLFRNEVYDEFDRVDTDLATRLTKENIRAGQNVTVTYDSEGDVIISSLGGGGGGGGDVTKENILLAMGYQEIEIEMKDTNGVEHKWRVMGVRDNGSQPTPTPTGDVTKANILAAMGYTEFSMEMEDEDGVAGVWNIIGVQIS